MSNRISIIIPVFNEAKNILNLINHLEAESTGFVQEIIVVDGGSTDGIKHVLKNRKKLALVSSEKGRAIQMNFGASLAKSEILYFLHADSFPPSKFDQYIIRFYEQKRRAGCFRLKFNSQHWWLKIAGYLSIINHICCRGGDQSLYVDKEIFQELGGFDEKYTIYEDNEFINKIYKKPGTRFKVINKPIITSARLYNKLGIWKVQRIYFEIYLHRFLGAGPEQLLERYKKLL